MIVAICTYSWYLSSKGLWYLFQCTQEHHVL